MKRIRSKIFIATTCGIVALTGFVGCSNNSTSFSTNNSTDFTSSILSNINDMSSMFTSNLLDSPVSVANRTMEALLEPNGVDGQAIIDLLPDSVVEQSMTVNDVSSKEELATTFAEFMNYIISVDTEHNQLAEIEYTIQETFPVSSSKLETIQEIYQEINLEIDEAQLVDIFVSYSSTENEMIHLPVIRIDRNWYLDVYSM